MRTVFRETKKRHVAGHRIAVSAALPMRSVNRTSQLERIMNAFELYNEKGEATGVWCCGECRKLVLSPAWRPESDNPKSTREAAEQCCQTPRCVVCGEEKRKDYNVECDSCRNKRWHKEREDRRLRQLASATDVTDEYDGPVHYESGGGDMGDGFYSSAEYLADCLYDDACDDDVWAFACKSRVEQLNLDRAIEDLCSDGYEDMADRLNVPDSLQKAVDEFNALNAEALTIYEPDSKRKVRIKVSSVAS